MVWKRAVGAMQVDACSQARVLNSSGQEFLALEIGAEFSE